jgi:UDP:flavonoid glycosyltransferase YjiC (YdhE family)
MARIFLATEADEGLGHVVPWTSFVAQALEHGYEVHMAAPDVGMLNQHIGAAYPVQLWSSPRVRNTAHTRQSTQPSVKSWPELLVSLGYAQALVLQGAVKAWRSILGRVRPSIVVADYAPALMLAAWTMGIPFLEVGNGFCVPPLVPHLQSFPGIKNQNLRAIADADAQLALAYSECLKSFGKPSISSIGEMQSWPVSRIVMSPPELDSYFPRGDVVHAGLLQGGAFEVDSSPTTSLPSVVGYLKGNTPGLDVLIDLLVLSRINALIYISDGKTGGYGNRGSVTLTDQPIPLSSALNRASVYLSNGGLSGVGQALCKGCWPVIVPQQAEQVATARNLLLRGWCGVWLPDSGSGTEERVQALFTPPANEPRSLFETSGESALFKEIERLGSGNVRSV